MSKPNTKKMFTVMITVAMVFSALAILSLAATPASAAASGTFTTNPTTFAIDGSGHLKTTIVTVNGGSFDTGSTVSFWISTTTTSAGRVDSSTALGTYALSASQTTLNNAVVSFSDSTNTLTAGTTYYLLASDSASTNSYILGPSVNIVSPAPTFNVYISGSTPPTGSNAANVGSSVEAVGSGFDSAASVSIYLSNPGNSTVLTTATTLASGAFDVYFTVPALSGTVDVAGSALTGISSYSIVAQETTSYSATNSFGGVSVDSSMDVAPAITVSPISYSGATGTSLTITGSGFASGQKLATNAVTVGGSATTGASATVASDGSFTVTVVTTVAETPSATTGPLAIVIPMTNPTPGADSFSDAVYVSSPNPTILGFSFSVTAVGTSDYVGNPVSAAVWNFPSSQTVDVYLGSVLIGTFTTDSNGFGEISSASIVPAMPGGSYHAVAEVPSSGIYVYNSTATAIVAYFDVVDPAGTAITTGGSGQNEYVPSAGMLTVQAYGLDPTSQYDAYDAAAASGVYDGGSGLTPTVIVGTESSSYGMYPAANGTLIFSYSPAYTSTTTSTTPSAVTFGTVISSSDTISVSVTGYATNAYGYNTIGPVLIPASSSTDPYDFTIYQSGVGSTVTVSNLIPFGSNAYPGVASSYNAYIGTSELTVTFTYSSASHTSTKFYASTTGSLTLSFTVPSVSGLYELNATYNGNTTAVGNDYVILSTTGSSASSGSLVVLPVYSSTGTLTNYEAIGYGYSASPTLYFMEYGALKNPAVTSFTQGAFYVSLSSTDSSFLTDQPAGTYSVFTSQTASPSNYFIYGSYAVVAEVTLGKTSGGIGTSVTASVTGLKADTYYNEFFNGAIQTTVPVKSDHTGALSFSAFTIPTMAKGKYLVTVVPNNGTTSVASAKFTVKANSDLTLTTLVPQYAFPGEIVQFSVQGLTLPTLKYNGGTQNVYVTGYEANVSLNGTSFATVPATYADGYLNGSFVMPNYNVTYYELTIAGAVEYSNYLSGSILGSSNLLTTGIVPMIGSQSDFLGLMQGNGALLTGISSGEIATLELAINSTVTRSLSIPISELNAAITSINGAVATLKTTVGNISVDLSTINATVVSISAGVVKLDTLLGTVNTSLASIDATLVSFNGTLVTLNTAIGTQTATLNSINGTVTSTATSVSGLVGSVATISTDVGTISGTITSVQGSVATIQTAVGNLNTSVASIQTSAGQIKSSQGTNEIFEIVIVVLVLITLVAAFLAITSVGKVAKRLEEQKKP